MLLTVDLVLLLVRLQLSNFTVDLSQPGVSSGHNVHFNLGGSNHSTTREKEVHEEGHKRRTKTGLDD